MPLDKTIPGKRWVCALLSFGLAAGLAGCSGNPPIDTVSSADTAVNQAMTVNAPQYAPMELQRALDKLARAKQAMEDRDYGDARHLAEEARVDAQVAEAKARSENAQRTVRETRQTIETLRREAESRTSGATGE
jgi:hypothetical protein